MSYSTAKEWLDAWDRGVPVESVSMSLKELGPQVEQTIQTMTAELIRIIHREGCDCNAWANPEDATDWNRDRVRVRELALQNPVIQQLDWTDAQYSAALFLAAKFCVRGPDAVLQYPEVQDRKIEVRRGDHGLPK